MKCTCQIIEGPEEIVHQKCALCKAAPELLEELIDAKNCVMQIARADARHEPFHITPERIQKWQAAIAKADGRS